MASDWPRSSAPMPGIRAGRVDEGEQRQPELLGELHEPQRLAVALRARHAEVAVDLLLGVAALLVADHHARLAVEAREAADDRRVVGVAAVAVQLAEVAEQAVDVVERVRPLRMARDLRDLPRRELAVDLLGELLALLLQPADLVGDVDRRVLVDVAQLVDLRLQLGDRLLEIEKGLLHGDGRADAGSAHHSASAASGTRAVARAAYAAPQQHVDVRDVVLLVRRATRCESRGSRRTPRAAAARRCGSACPGQARARARDALDHQRAARSRCRDTAGRSARGRSTARRTCGPDRARAGSRRGRAAPDSLGPAEQMPGVRVVAVGILERAVLLDGEHLLPRGERRVELAGREPASRDHCQRSATGESRRVRVRWCATIGVETGRLATPRD